MKLPDLIPGQVYMKSEVLPYIAPQEGATGDDFALAAQHWLPVDWARRKALHETEPMRVEYRLVPVEELESQIRQLWQVFEKVPEEARRVRAIRSIIESGEVQFPVFVYGDDQEQRIREGMHRAVAFWQLGSPVIPVFVTR